jgi:hypothetical protein
LVAGGFSGMASITSNKTFASDPFAPALRARE